MVTLRELCCGMDDHDICIISMNGGNIAFDPETGGETWLRDNGTWWATSNTTDERCELTNKEISELMAASVYSMEVTGWAIVCDVKL